METTQPPAQEKGKKNSKKIIFIVAGIGILCLICIAIVVALGLFALPGLTTPEPTPTPIPTNTPLPPTPLPPTAVPPENTPESSQEGTGCTYWKDITSSMEGEKLCVYGDVHKTYNTNEAWRIDFGSEKNSFFMYDTKYYYNVNIGDCVKAEGTIKLISGNVPYLNIENQKLYFCE